MKEHIQKLDDICKKYTDHEYVHATLLSAAGIITMVTFMGQLSIGV